jgi:hypothetical protein
MCVFAPKFFIRNMDLTFVRLYCRSCNFCAYDLV